VDGDTEMAGGRPAARHLGARLPPPARTGLLTGPNRPNLINQE